MKQSKKELTLEEAILCLENHNKWRRGDDTYKLQDPKKIGIAIDVVLNAAKNQLKQTIKNE